MAILEITNQQVQTQIPLDQEHITFVCRQGDALNGVKEAQAPPFTLIGLLHTRRGWVVIDYTGDRTYVKGLRVADAKLVGDKDQIQFAEYKASIVSQRSEIVAAGSPLLEPEVICQYCSCGFSVGESVTYCPACETAHHSDCWEACANGCAMGISCGYQKNQDNLDR